MLVRCPSDEIRARPTSSHSLRCYPGPNAAQALSLLGFQQEYESLVQGTYNPLDNGLYFVWRWGEKDKLAENNGEEKISQTPCKHKGGHTTVHR